VAEVRIELGLVLFFRLVGENDGFGGKAMFFGIKRDCETARFGSRKHIVYLRKV